MLKDEGIRFIHEKRRFGWCQQPLQKVRLPNAQQENCKMSAQYLLRGVIHHCGMLRLARRDNVLVPMQTVRQAAAACGESVLGDDRHVS